MLASLVLAMVVPASDKEWVSELSAQVRVRWVRGEEPVVWVLPSKGEGYTQLAQRLCGSAGKARALAGANPNLTQPLAGIRLRIPWKLLSATKQAELLQTLFPKDARVSGGWEHEVVAPWGGEPESFWEVALWFTGDGSRYLELRQANPQVPLFPPVGARILVPEKLLLPALRALPVKKEATQVEPTPVPAPPQGTQPSRPTPTGAAPTPEPTPAPSPAKAAPPTPTGTSRGRKSQRWQAPPGVPLEYGEHEAVYRLAPGEALYSAVVVRFTGLLHAADVNATAMNLAELSGISDVTAIPVGYPIRIPFDLLLPEYLPLGHPRRQEWEKEREELSAIRRVLRAANLDGIHVILDAGHGGSDTGAVANGVWEATYTYDVMTRLKGVLERETKATVWLLVRDEDLADRPEDTDQLPKRRRQRLLTSPPYELEDSSTGVHLRWVLTNALLKKLAEKGVDSERVVFVSIHADSLHPSVRGLMVYVPGRKFRPRQVRAPSYLPRVAELARGGRANFTPRWSARSEALSLQLADSLVASARRFNIPVHAFDPVRSYVIRGGGAWVPAVLRFSSVPTSVLVEIANLNNEEDRKLLLSWRFREKLAHAIAAGLAEGFSR